MATSVETIATSRAASAMPGRYRRGAATRTLMVAPGRNAQSGIVRTPAVEFGWRQGMPTHSSVPSWTLEQEDMAAVLLRLALSAGSESPRRRALSCRVQLRPRAVRVGRPGPLLFSRIFVLGGGGVGHCPADTVLAIQGW